MSVWGLESGHQAGSATENQELAVRLDWNTEKLAAPFLSQKQTMDSWVEEEVPPVQPASLGMSRPGGMGLQLR